MDAGVKYRGPVGRYYLVAGCIEVKACVRLMSAGGANRPGLQLDFHF